MNSLSPLSRRHISNGCNWSSYFLSLPLSVNLLYLNVQDLYTTVAQKMAIWLFASGLNGVKMWEYRYSLVDLREHIKKRPPIATTEKVQHYIKVSFLLSHV